MNLQAKDLLDNTGNLLKNAQEGVDISQLFQGVKIPDLDDLSQLMKSVLPQNLTQFDTEGALQLLSPFEFQDKIKQGIESMQGLIQDQIKSVISEVTSSVENIQDSSSQAESMSEQVGSLINGNQQGMFDGAMESVSKISDASVDIPVISKFSQSISKATDNIKSLTPKQVRDLADPDYYNQVVSDTLGTANKLLEQDIVNTAKEYISAPPSIESVTSMFSTGNSLIGNFGPTASGEPYILEASIITYYGKGDGADLDAYKKKTPTGKQLQSGKSCAVDNVNILYNSKVEVPGLGTFTAVDRLRGGNSNLMLYYDTKEQAEAANKKIKGRVPVTVTPPGESKSVAKAEPLYRGKDAKNI